MSEAQSAKTKRRVKRRKVVARSNVARDPYYTALIDVAHSIDPEDIRALLRKLQSRGFDLGNVDDFLVDFDWDSALRLLPFLMEYAESMRSASSGAEKEKQTLALLLRIATLAGVEDKFDEHAVTTLRIVIEKLSEMSKGQYKINIGRFARLLGAISGWLLRHCSCTSRS